MTHPIPDIPSPTNRRQALQIVGALAAAGLLPSHALATEVIDKVALLVGFGVGGGFDQTARGVQEALQKSGLVRDVAVENRTGGGGSVALAS